MSAARLLVLGAAGRLGRRVVPLLRESGVEVLTPSHAELDAADRRALEVFLVEQRVDRCVSLVAATDVARCERDVQYATRNPETAEAVAQACDWTGVESLFVSTDYVMPLLVGRRSNVYGASKLVAEWSARRHDARVLRVAFTTPEQCSRWQFVNAYTESNRAWVEDTARALCEYTLRDEWHEIAALCPPATTFETLLRERFPQHAALDDRVLDAEAMRARVGVAAPQSTRFDLLHDHELVRHERTTCWS